MNYCMYFFHLITNMSFPFQVSMATGPAGRRTVMFMPTTLPGIPAAPTVLTGASAAAGPGKGKRHYVNMELKASGSQMPLTSLQCS